MNKSTGCYPSQLEHDAQHEHLLEELGRFGSQMTETETQFLMNYLRNWLQDHILTQDKDFGAFLKKAETSLHERRQGNGRSNSTS